MYGHPNELWEVTLPAEEVPPELPEPALGINFARDGMKRTDWLSLVAVHSDCWLLSVAFYFGARLNRNERCIFLSCHICLSVYPVSCILGINACSINELYISMMVRLGLVISGV